MRVQAPVAGIHAPVLLQVLLMLPSNPSEHAAVQVAPAADPAHAAGQAAVPPAAAAAAGKPAHATRVQDPDTGNQVPVLPQLLLTLPLKPAEQGALQTLSAAAPAQLLGQPAVFAGAAAVGVPWHATCVQAPCAEDHTPELLQLLVTLPVNPAEQLAVQATPAAAPAQVAGQPAVLAGAAVLGLPAQVTCDCVQAPSTADHTPLLPQVVLTPPVDPAEQFALHTVPAAAGAQVAGQLSAFAATAVGLL
jgi:hypothetical protein